ncbi:MAG: RNA polymerase sigma factor [Thermaerobacter sp.]|nr:RNA polymerase sigma factor [Thermaerobacter sp.]
MELWQRAQRGDPDAFLALADTVWPLLYRTLLPYVGHRETTEDLAQEALLQAWRRLPSFRGESRVETWILSIGFNLARNERRRRRPDLTENFLEGFGPSAEAVALQREQWTRVGRAVADLPPLWRAALLLVAREGLSYEEAARVMDCRPSTLRNWVHRARVRVRTKLAEADGVPPQSGKVVATREGT